MNDYCLMPNEHIFSNIMAKTISMRRLYFVLDQHDKLDFYVASSH